DEAESSERNQRDPPRLVPKVHIVSDDEATFDCRGRHQDRDDFDVGQGKAVEDRKSTRLNSSHVSISYAVFCLKKKTSELQSRFDLVCRLLLETKILSVAVARLRSSLSAHLNLASLTSSRSLSRMSLISDDTHT